MARINQLYEKIAAQIRTQLSEGTLPWHKPWAVDPDRQVSKPLRENAVPYQGIKVLILWGAAIEAGYASPFWITYRQAQSVGAQVRRVYAVFNADQIDDLPAKYVPDVPDANPDARDAACQAWFNALGIDIRYGGERAYYAPGPDRIQMPHFETFESSQTFYSTLLHETVHGSGHRSRLDRDFGPPGTPEYAREELVAELGSAFLCADLGIASSPRADHASYIASWLKLLEDEPGPCSTPPRTPSGPWSSCTPSTTPTPPGRSRPERRTDSQRSREHPRPRPEHRAPTQPATCLDPLYDFC